MYNSTHFSTVINTDSVRSNSRQKPTQFFQSPRVSGISFKQQPTVSSTKHANTVLDPTRMSLKKSPSAVINKYYKNFGIAQQNKSLAGTTKLGSMVANGSLSQASSKQEIKRSKKDLTITFQKDKSRD